MADVDFFDYKQPIDAEEIIQWYVVLLVSDQRAQHTLIEKTCNLRNFAQNHTDDQHWNIAVYTTVENEMIADSIIYNLTNEPKSRGCSSRSVVFEKTIRALNLPVYSDLRYIFKHPDAEKLLVRCPTDSMPKSRARRQKY
jgi:hypothetical protein